MSGAHPPLDSVQRWMLSVITHPEGITSGVESPEAKRHLGVSPETIETVIQPSRACTALERLSVYGNAYTARLIECLEAEFPALLYLIGEESFRSFAAQYLQKHPPSSPNLNQLGRLFPAFLAESRRSVGDLDGDEQGWARFLIEVATLERIYAEVFDGPGEERVPSTFHEQLQQLSPDNWADLRLETAPSLRMVRFEFPVHEYLTAIRQNQNPEPPAPQTTWLIVHRRDFIVRRQAVPETAWRVLRGLQRGLPMSVALEQALQETSEEEPTFLDHIAEWFQSWTTAGYFRNVILEP
jgi:hypothetical protein